MPPESYFGHQFIEDMLKVITPSEPFSARSVYASEIGHPCLWYQCAKFTMAEARQVREASSSLLFEQGSHIEDLVQKYMVMGGWKILAKEKSFSWDNGKKLRYPLAGRCDFEVAPAILNTHRDGIPLEVKGLHPMTFDKLDPEKGIEQFLEAPQPWLRKYPGQVICYCFLDEKPECALHIVNKANYGQHKTIWFRLEDHLDYAEELLKRTEDINLYLEAEEEPPKLPEYSEVWCRWCDFYHVCLPNQNFGEGAEFIDDPELEEQVARFLELKEPVSEYNRLDKRLKDLFKPGTKGKHHRGEGTQFLGTQFIIQTKHGKRHYAAKPAQEARSVDAWTIKFNELPNGEEGASTNE